MGNQLEQKLKTREVKDIYNSNPCGDIHVTNWIISLKDKFEDTKGLIRSGKSKKDRQYNGQ
jgi:hypothetical protein